MIPILASDNFCSESEVRQLMILLIILGVWMTLVVIASFLYIPAIPGFGATGHTARLIVYHVPTAWVAALAYLMATINSVAYLWKKDRRMDCRAQVNAELGTLFCILATVTGAIWSKAAWGVFWNWDPRQSSIAVLLMIYTAFFILRGAVDDSDRRARLSAVYAIMAFLTVPFLVFIVPRIYPSLHPDLNWGRGGVSVMTLEMLIVFISSLVGFTGLYLWIYNLQLRLTELLYHQSMKKGV